MKRICKDNHLSMLVGRMDMGKLDMHTRTQKRTYIIINLINITALKLSHYSLIIIINENVIEVT